MKKYFDRAKINDMKNYIKEKCEGIYRYSKVLYLALSRKQQRALILGFVIFFVVLVMLIVSSHFHEVASKSGYPIHFEKQTYLVSKPGHKIILLNKYRNRAVKLQWQLQQLKATTHQQYQLLNAQLQAIRSNMDSLASQRDVVELQQTIDKPNKNLLDKVTSLQHSVQAVVQQTAKKIWVNPKFIEHYFRLVAVQGFSDGMRAIIDVDGNQMALSPHEICPACRGWVLQRMNFSGQTALFSKHIGNQIRYVKLHAK